PSDFGLVARVVVEDSPALAVGQAGEQPPQRRRMFRVKLQGTPEQTNRLVEVLPGEGLQQRNTPQVAVVSAEILRWLARGSLDLGPLDAWRQVGDDLFGHRVLQDEDVLDRPVEAIGPQVVTSFAIDELTRDAHPVSCLPYAALQHVADAELAADLL